VRVFFDSSAFAKRYVREKGSEEVFAFCSRASEAVMSALAKPELVAALWRSRRRGRLREHDFRLVREELRLDLADATMIHIDDPIIARAVECVEEHPLQAADAVHVASALHAGCDLFVTADRQQCAAARALGLKTELVG
jgi:hypothetical protein